MTVRRDGKIRRRINSGPGDAWNIRRGLAHGGISSMSSANTSQARRVRVERGIYRRPNGLLEIGWRDTTGKQRWRRPKERGLRAARAALAEENARRARGEKVADDARLKFHDAADAGWEARAAN